MKRKNNFPPLRPKTNLIHTPPLLKVFQNVQKTENLKSDRGQDYVNKIDMIFGTGHISTRLESINLSSTRLFGTSSFVFFCTPLKLIF